MLKVIRICKLVASETLQQEHFEAIKNELVTKNKKIKNTIFTWEGGKNIIC